MWFLPATAPRHKSEVQCRLSVSLTFVHVEIRNGYFTLPQGWRGKPVVFADARWPLVSGGLVLACLFLRSLFVLYLSLSRLLPSFISLSIHLSMIANEYKCFYVCTSSCVSVTTAPFRLPAKCFTECRMPRRPRGTCASHTGASAFFASTRRQETGMTGNSEGSSGKFYACASSSILSVGVFFPVLQ